MNEYSKAITSKFDNPCPCCHETMRAGKDLIVKVNGQFWIHAFCVKKLQPGDADRIWQEKQAAKAQRQWDYLHRERGYRSDFWDLMDEPF